MARMKKACIIGYPVKHSRSPVIHGYWLKRHGIEGSYGKEEVKPEDFAAFLKAMPSMGYAGANVTLPHKLDLLALADHCSDGARKIGAANMLWFENGRLHADNTDFVGFIASLDAEAPGWDDRRDVALVLGAGGASRAIVHGLLARGVSRVMVANRTLATAEAMARDFGIAIVPCAWQDAGRYVGEANLIVNTTSLGMSGQPLLDLPLDTAGPETVLADAVYVPLRTALITTAAARGLRAVGGLGMLLHQAVPSFERWFGLRPEVTPELTRLVEADVLGSR
jgi:shikimate dehydrogenase